MQRLAEFYDGRRPVHILDELEEDEAPSQPEPQPFELVPAEENFWEGVGRQREDIERARVAMRAAREVGQRGRAVHHEVDLGVNQEGQRRVAIFNPITGNYEIRNR